MQLLITTVCNFYNYISQQNKNKLGGILFCGIIVLMLEVQLAYKYDENTTIYYNTANTTKLKMILCIIIDIIMDEYMGGELELSIKHTDLYDFVPLPPIHLFNYTFILLKFSIKGTKLSIHKLLLTS